MSKGRGEEWNRTSVVKEVPKVSRREKKHRYIIITYVTAWGLIIKGWFTIMMHDIHVESTCIQRESISIVTHDICCIIR